MSDSINQHECNNLMLLGSMTESLKALKSDIKSLQDTLKNLSDKIGDLTTKYSAITVRLEAAQQQLSSKETLLSQLATSQVEISASQKGISDFLNHVESDTKQDIDDYRIILAEATKQIKSFETEINNLSERIGKIEHIKKSLIVIGSIIVGVATVAANITAFIDSIKNWLLR